MMQPPPLRRSAGTAQGVRSTEDDMRADAPVTPPDDRDPIAKVAALRQLGATSVEIELTRGGTWRVRASWATPEPAGHQWSTGRKS